MALMVSLTYITINYKTFEKEAIDIGQLDLDALDEEDIPITDQNIVPPPPPPPPPVVPEEIEIVEDEKEIEETVIESTETDQQEEIVEVEDIEVEEVEEDNDVPFNVIENVPIFPGCEKEKGNNAKKQCMSDKISKFVNKKFNTDLASDLGLSGRQRINVIFKIDKTGNIVGVQARAPHPGLEKEAKRVIRMLPKMKPGKQRGKPVNVPYSLPILFQVQD
jgi:protein TonB